jgi:hypothetical protein
MKDDSKKIYDKTNDNVSLEQAKKDICVSARVRKKSISDEEIQNKIDELNLNKAKKELEEESAININDILLKNIESKKTTVMELKTMSDLEENEKLIISKEIPKQEVSSITEHSKNKKISEFEVINQDGYLKPFENKIRERYNAYKNIISNIEKYEGSFLSFCEGYRKLGLNVTDEGIYFREYAPAAKKMSIVNKIINLNSLVILMTGIEMNINVFKMNSDFGPF